jgi:hypothetical protein
MLTKFTVATLACALGALAIANPAAARINERQDRQQHRIAKGVASGSLTAREATRLERQQAHIARYEARSRADGPGLTHRERANIARMQNHSSRSIYRQKHDAQFRR